MLNFEGSIRESTIAAVLNFFNASDYFGYLAIKHPEGFQGVVYIEKEQITYAHLSGRKRRFGDLLVEKNLLTARKLDHLLQKLKDEKFERSLAALIRSEELISEEELISCIKEETRAVIFDLLGWSNGVFRFFEGHRVPKEYIPCPIAIETLVQQWYHLNTRSLPDKEEMSLADAKKKLKKISKFMNVKPTDQATFHQAEQRSLDILTPKKIEYSPKHKERLQSIFNELGEAASQHLSVFLRTDITFQMTAVLESSYNQFLTIVASDFVHHLIELNPTVDIGLISFHAEIASQMLNYMISGNDDVKQSFVDFSSIEDQLCDRIAQILADVWSPITRTHLNFELRPKTRYRIDHHKNLSHASVPLLVGNFDCRIGSSYSKTALCFPRAACDVLLT